MSFVKYILVHVIENTILFDRVDDITGLTK